MYACGALQMFRCCSDYILPEHTRCSDCQWFAHKIKIQYVKMLLDLNIFVTELQARHITYKAHAATHDLHQVGSREHQ